MNATQLQLHDIQNGCLKCIGSIYNKGKLSQCSSDLPLADALHSDSKGPLQTGAELKGIAADFNDVVDESAHGSQREGRGEEHHVTKLDKHLLVVLEGVLKGTEWKIRPQLCRASTLSMHLDTLTALL